MAEEVIVPPGGPEKSLLEIIFDTSAPGIKQLVALDYDKDILPVVNDYGNVIFTTFRSSSLNEAVRELEKFAMHLPTKPRLITFQVRFKPTYRVKAADLVNIGYVFDRCGFDADIVWGCLVDPSQIENARISFVASLSCGHPDYV